MWSGGGDHAAHTQVFLGFPCVAMESFILFIFFVPVSSSFQDHFWEGRRLAHGVLVHWGKGILEKLPS